MAADIDIEIVIEKDTDADIEKESDSVVAKIFAFCFAIDIWPDCFDFSSFKQMHLDMFM